MKNPFLILMLSGLLLSRPELGFAEKASPSSSYPSLPMSQSASPSLPLFYKSLVPFSSTEHAKLALPRGAANLAFAAATDIIPLLVTEVQNAIGHYPIAFIKDKSTSVVTIVALVGRGDGKNRFVQASGQWREGVYVPAWVRRYPFALVSGSKGEVMLAVDTKAEFFAGQRDAQPLVDTDGKPTQALQKIVEFQKEFMRLSQLTERVVQELVMADILEDAGMSIRNKGSDKPLNVKGFMVVNERKLKALKSEQVDQLFRSDALGLAYAQLLSMNKLPQLIDGIDD